MQESIDRIKNRIKNKNYNYNSNNIKEEIPKKNKKYFKNLTTRFLIALIFVLASIIFTKYSTQNLDIYKKYILNDSLSFSKINNVYEKYLGGVLPFDKIVKETAKPVFQEKLTYTNKESYKDGLKLSVAQNYMIPAINSGIVVFIGEKENYGNTVIVQGVDGVDIWYGNTGNIKLKLYDYVEKGKLIGESMDDKLFLVLQKDGKFLNYEEYNK